MTDRELKQAAVNRAAIDACAAQFDPELLEKDRRRQRVRLTNALRVLRECLNDLQDLQGGNALAAPGITDGEAS